MAGGNSGKPPNYKHRQRNVSVYIGPKGGHLDDLLDLCCRWRGKTASEFMRYLLIEKLLEWELIDHDHNPVAIRVEKLRSAISTELLPKSLDLE